VNVLPRVQPINPLLPRAPVEALPAEALTAAAPGTDAPLHNAITVTETEGMTKVTPLVNM
jgi:hypothetical protein